MAQPSGVLYLCGTPIGNLEDITYRAVRVLSEVDVIAAEDTRHTRILLNHFNITTPMISYHEHNKHDCGPVLVERLLKGNNVAVVSDAGMPGIADPGSHLVGLATAAGITVVPIPGANAALAALVCSGLDTTSFTFAGFLPKTAKKRQARLEELEVLPHTLVFYEAPHRLQTILAEMLDAFGDRQAVAGREMTKKFEQFVYGSLSTIKAHFELNSPRGEFTLIVAGRSEAEDAAGYDINNDTATLQAVSALVQAGINKKDAIKIVAEQYGIPKRQVYNLMVNGKW